ncbi:hypothetical protein CEY15_02330 [Dietzia natronolimnaea]|uniref:Major capsid protein E n=1 Tax=Dietzia natronolimnaea TaxID=161920 RepID=A0A2A2WUD2_9ACTN|nr:major capsid protein [Dietzia natronolimnaea]PAY24653.1 hypothetical protein CEY15_02330 [Dietzia natronolimnaea]
MPLYPGHTDLNGNLITVDEALNHPTVITERLADLTFDTVLVDKVFGTVGQPVTGGAVIYSQTTEKHLFVEGVADRKPGDEYPVIFSEKPDAQLARVQDFGGKFPVTDEARRRNNSIDFDNAVTRLANTITRKLNSRAIETLEAALGTLDDGGEIAGHPWTDLALDGATPTPASERPTADLAAAQLAADEDELGITYSMLLVHPRQRAALATAYGERLKAVMDAAGMTLASTTQVPAGTAYVVDPGTVGFVDYEMPLTSETWDDREHRQTWVQSYAMPVMGVTSPRSVRKLTGLAA